MNQFDKFIRQERIVLLVSSVGDVRRQPHTRGQAVTAGGIELVQLIARRAALGGGPEIGRAHV